MCAEHVPSGHQPNFAHPLFYIRPGRMQVLSLPVTDSGTPSQQACSSGHARAGMFERTRSSGHVRAGLFERACSSGHVRADTFERTRSGGGAGTIFFKKRLSSPAKSKNASVLFVPDSRSSHTSGHKKYSIFDFSVELRMFFFRRWMPCCRLQTERADRLFCCPPSEFHALPCQYAKLVRVPHALHFRDIICSLKHP